VEYLFYKAVQRSGGILNGCTMDAMTVSLAADGQPLENYWPYLTVQPPSWVPPPGMGRVWKSNSDMISPLFDEVVGLVSIGTPIVLGLIITDRFLNCDSSGRLPTLSDDRQRAGHAVVAIGHGEDSKGAPYVLIRNSWGTAWGLGGHAWLDRQYTNAQLKEAMILK
jgi:hypothetical protein